MAIKNTAQLYAALADEGFKGPNSREGVDAFLTSEDGKHITGLGKDILDKLFARKAVLSVVADEPAEDPVEIERQETATARAKAAAERGNPANATMNRVSAKNMRNIWNRKAYTEKIKNSAALPAHKRPIFADADQAEQAGAYMRLAIMQGCTWMEYPQKAADTDIVKASMSNLIPGTGGVLVPEIYTSELIYLTEEYGVARKIANVQPMSSDIVHRNRKTSIISMSHNTVATAPTATSNNYDLVRLAADKADVLITCPNELLEDSSINIADDVGRSVNEAQMIREDQDYFIGDGSATYGNFSGLQIALPSSAYIAGAGNAWSALTLANIHTLMGSVENVNWGRCAFVCSRQFFHQVLMRLTYGTALGNEGDGPPIAQLLPPGGAYQGTCLGIPVYFSQVMQTVSGSAKFNLYFGDFQGATMLGDRRQLNVKTSEHAYFTSDTFAFYASARFAINIHGDGRGSTYGPVVCLKTT